MKLTDEQIAELAPEWATHYFTNKIGDIVFQSSDSYAVIGCGAESIASDIFLNRHGIHNLAKPIPRKPEPFDITQHEWSDDKLSLLIGDADLISINDNCSGSCFDLHKDDVIALAKHFGVTAEDLK